MIAPFCRAFSRWLTVSLLILCLPAGGWAEILEIDRQASLVTVQAQNASLEDIVKRLGREMKFEVFPVGQWPEVKVTESFRRLPVAQALARLLTANSYAIEKDDVGRVIRLEMVSFKSESARVGKPAAGLVRPPLTRAASPPPQEPAQEGGVTVVGEGSGIISAPPPPAAAAAGAPPGQPAGGRPPEPMMESVVPPLNLGK